MSLMLMIKCPVTHLTVPTGIITDKEALSQLKCESAVFKCPACGEDHHWSSLELSLSAPTSDTNAGYDHLAA
jgi:hypothetical protein